VLKPDLNTLERAIDEVAKDVDPDSAPAERRHAPAREVSAPVPTGAADAQAFYEALNEAAEGDTLLSITAAEGPAALAADVAATLRGSDRLLASSTAMQVLLLGGGDVGARSFVDRLVQTRGRQGLAVRSIVLGPNETPADGFDRLKRSEPHPA
jgi:hypothetical protein